MGVFKTLADLQKKTEKPEKRESIREHFLTLEDGKSVRMRFLQEVAQDGANYTEERGTAQIIAVHSNPLNFKRSAICTMDIEGHCWACEKIVDDFKWKPKLHMVINVAVLEEDVWVRKVLDQKFFSNNVGSDIIDLAAEFGTVMDRTYKFSRKGKKTETNYSLMSLTEAKEPEELKDVEMVDLSKAFYHVAYEDQELFYFNTGGAEKTESTVSSW